MQTPKNTKKRSIVAAGALALAAMLGSAGASAVYAPSNLIVNGSFEEVKNGPADIAPASGEWITVYNGKGAAGYSATDNNRRVGSITGWTFGGYGVEVRNNVAGAAYDGNNFIELDTTQNAWIRQTVSTIKDQEYELTFYASPREGVAQTSNKLKVFWNGTLLDTLKKTGVGNTGNVWDEYSFTVMGTGGNDVLRFAAAGTSDRFGMGLDNVSLTAVPLPPAAILFGGALFGLAVVGRRRRADGAQVA